MMSDRGKSAALLLAAAHVEGCTVAEIREVEEVKVLIDLLTDLVFRPAHLQRAKGNLVLDCL